MANKSSKKSCFKCKTAKYDVRLFYFTGDRKPTSSKVHICSTCAGSMANITLANNYRI